MSDKIYAVAPDWKKRAFIDKAKYDEMYSASIADPDKFLPFAPDLAVEVASPSDRPG